MRVIERPDGARIAQFRNVYGGGVKCFSIYLEGSESLIQAWSSGIGVPGMMWKRSVGRAGSSRERGSEAWLQPCRSRISWSPGAKPSTKTVAERGRTEPGPPRSGLSSRLAWPG